MRRSHRGRAVAFGVFVVTLAMNLLVVGVRSAPGVDVASSEGQPEIARGMFLVADADLLDPNFSRTVILITHHGSRGSVGVVINRPTNVPLARALPQAKALAGRSEVLFVGGPVLPQTPVFLIRATEPVPSSRHVFGDVYFMSNLDTLSRLLDDGDNPKVAFRAYAGYAGWAPGQLEAEIESGSWHLVRADPSSIFDQNPEKVWDAMIQRASELLI